MLLIAPEILGNPAATLTESEQKMEVCVSIFSCLFIVSLAVCIGMGSHTSRTPSLLGAKSASSAIDVRNKLQYWRVELVLHACLLRLVCTCPEFREYLFICLLLLLILLMPFGR